MPERLQPKQDEVRRDAVHSSAKVGLILQELARPTDLNVERLDRAYIELGFAIQALRAVLPAEVMEDVASMVAA